MDASGKRQVLDGTQTLTNWSKNLLKIFTAVKENITNKQKFVS